VQIIEAVAQILIFMRRIFAFGLHALACAGMEDFGEEHEHHHANGQRDRHLT
jgi:hypothetical protein